MMQETRESVKKSITFHLNYLESNLLSPHGRFEASHWEENTATGRESGYHMAEATLFVALGVAAGIFCGIIGIGGGIIIVPALVILFGMTQHQAQGTTLALLVPPIGFLAGWT
jgi:hypothetical protein